MKNQYVGDVNDYRKYGLLRALLASGSHKLLVAWMLTPDDGGKDGERRSYLRHPDTWKHFDSELYGGLASVLKSTSVRKVSLIEQADLLPRTHFYSTQVPDSLRERDRWRESLFAAAAGVDLVFLDPDNGIEVPSRPPGCKGSSKYVTWSEIQGLWAAGCSLLIYQHYPRAPREAFTHRTSSELRRRLDSSSVIAFHTAHVLFLLVVQPKHESVLRAGISLGLQSWQGQIRQEAQA